ncbi:MAG: VWA domain-containing protein [Alteromonadaceae bacterium]|nr:VWA domain-containing protein [Alteromonadaceae bacterium]
MADFHFIRPFALLGVFILLLALYLLKKFRVSQSGWQQLLPPHLSRVLMDGEENNRPVSFLRSLTMPFIVGLLAIIALAGPTWQKLPQPVYQLQQGSVLIMDMSYSMYATDLSPNRLTRARYKAIDLLENLSEGDIGLVAYAGDAFTISPLTQDSNNIRLLLPSLTPDIMPEFGSNPLAALELAHTMLINAGHAKGDIYWFTDGIDYEDIQDITDWSRKHPHHLNILGIGTKNGAPIKLANGELMKDNSGAIIVPKLTEGRLLGTAQRGRGSYRTITNEPTDVLALLEKSKEARTLQNDESKKTDDFKVGDQWQEAGPYLLLIILPLVLSYFRRGNLLISLWLVMPLTFILLPGKQVYAAQVNQTQSPAQVIPQTPQVEEASFQHSVKKHWNNLWKTNDQQAQEKFDQEDFSQAAQQFDNNLWQGSAHYRAGDFEQALQSFQKSNSAQALYNQGNSLAKLQKLDEAIKAYDQALKKDPKHQDSLKNKKLLEQLKQQQEQEQEQKDQQGDQKQDNKDAEQNQSDQNKSDQDKSEQDKSDQDKSEQDKSEQENSDQKDQQGDKQEQSNDAKDQQDQQKSEQEKQEQERKEQEAADAAKESAKNEQGENSEQDAQAKLIAEKLTQEKEQKHQQLLNKVTDDPYLLLRNKMRLESQKRNHNTSRAGVTKKW